MQTIPSTIPCSSRSLRCARVTALPSEGSPADVNLALAGLPSLCMRAPLVPTFTAEELAIVGAL